jgi:hypothetical protein
VAPLGAAAQDSRSRRQRRVVNPWKLDQYANEGETIIVPGKVLGDGVHQKVTIAAYSYSDEARSGCRRVHHPGAAWPAGRQGVRIMGLTWHSSSKRRAILPRGRLRR